MDKKNQIIGIICIIFAFILLFKVDSDKYTNAVKNYEQSTPSVVVRHDDRKTSTSKPLLQQHINSDQKEKISLENEHIRVEFLENYGAIDNIILKKYFKKQDSPECFVINENWDIPTLGICIGEDEERHILSGFKLQYIDNNTITFSKLGKNGIEIIREYCISQEDTADNDAYIIKHSTKFVNTVSSELFINHINLCLGTIGASNGDFAGEYLNFGYFDGHSASFIKSRDFAESNGFLGFGKRDSREYISKSKPIVWGSIKNQFFTAILTPSKRAIGFFAAPIRYEIDDGVRELDDGISGELIFKVGKIAPESEYVLDMDLYAGPKDFTRLDRMSSNQDLVMQFGFFGVISKLLLLIMKGIHSIVSNWGVSIILLTVIIKLCLWPLTTAQVRASKKMTAIQGPLRVIKEKYKNNPHKIQVETMKLFKQYRVNPAAGCLPIFIQIPIFFGLYYMLRTSSDLRFAHFLWIRDLSVADTIAYIGGFPINILPIIMWVTMTWQMHMTPMPSVDGSQKVVFKLMPLMFLFCCYGFPSGLVLYWTVQNVLTILQQYIVSKRRDMQIEQLLLEENITLKNRKGKKNK